MHFSLKIKSFLDPLLYRWLLKFFSLAASRNHSRRILPYFDLTPYKKRIPDYVLRFSYSTLVSKKRSIVIQSYICIHVYFYSSTANLRSSNLSGTSPRKFVEIRLVLEGGWLDLLQIPKVNVIHRLCRSNSIRARARNLRAFHRSRISSDNSAKLAGKRLARRGYCGRIILN